MRQVPIHMLLQINTKDKTLHTFFTEPYIKYKVNSCRNSSLDSQLNKATLISLNHRVATLWNNLKQMKQLYKESLTQSLNLLYITNVFKRKYYLLITQFQQVQ